MTVRLHIERLVVEGLDFLPADTRRLQAALVAELMAGLAAEEGARRTSLSVEALSPREVELPPEKSAEAVGRRAAVALLGGLLT